MRILHVNKLPRIVKNKRYLEKDLAVELSIKGAEIDISGEPEDEFTAEKIIEALDLGFPYRVAMLIKEEDFILQVINIKDHTRRRDLIRIKGRIIGTKGKTLKLLTDLSDNFFELDDKNNRVGIIGNPENIQTSHTAIISLIKGSKTGNVYTYLEKHRPEKLIDLGLKKPKETKKAKSNL